jgi:hypothetical protein
MYKICVYVPEEHLQQVKESLFAVGAGQIGDYDSCCWQSLGEGQFRPLEGSAPYIGQTGKVERVREYKLELVCQEKIIREAVAAMKLAHPYEEPAYDVWKLETF